MTNPYQALDKKAFWRPAVAERHPLDICDLWAPKYAVKQSDKLITAGSCFAQHIGRALSARGYEWLDAEPAPAFLGRDLASKYNYGIFSFRTGNIYTTALLKQWLAWAYKPDMVPEDAWEKNGRWFDPYRPAIEPEGYAGRNEMLTARLATLRAIKQAVAKADVFIFTLGLTEAWRNLESGHVYPLCPGTVAGEFDADLHGFHNFGHEEIRNDMLDAVRILREINPSIQVLLTVSPVPLTATATKQHVLVANTYSKSVLRGVAGELAQLQGIDYFPSYEIITATPFRGMFYEQNSRSVSRHGVDFVMDSFFRCLNGVAEESPPKAVAHASRGQKEGIDSRGARADAKCEEELLDAFAADARK